MNLADLETMREHIEFLKRMTANSKASHGWTFDDEIAALERILSELRPSQCKPGR